MPYGAPREESARSRASPPGRGIDDRLRGLVLVRRELQVHCYRILGSALDAEDALQETLLSDTLCAQTPAAASMCARERGHAVVTSDPDDMLRIDPALPVIRA